MDKIPAALQHKIDYINALDIPVSNKEQRIKIVTLDYQAYCRSRSDSEKHMPYFKGTVLESLATLLDKYNEDAAKKWEKFEDKGLKPAKNPPPMPPVKSPKRDVKVSISGINTEDMFTAESIAEALKEINSIGVQPSTPWPQIQTPSDILKYVPYESPNDKPIGPDDEIIKADTITWRYLSALLLSCILGNLLGFAIFKLLELAL
jgi:hypothetical protein